jgi:hypothetical protein
MESFTVVVHLLSPSDAPSTPDDAIVLTEKMRNQQFEPIFTDPEKILYNWPKAAFRIKAKDRETAFTHAERVVISLNLHSRIEVKEN